MATKKKTSRPAAKKPAAKKPAAKKPAGPLLSPSVMQLLAPVTPESLRKAAEALPSKFTRVSFSLGDTLADARELTGAREDLAFLQAKRFPVNEWLIKRIEYCVTALAPLGVTRAQADVAAMETTADAEVTRQRLLEIRAEVAALAETVGLAASYFKLGLHSVERINPVLQRVAEVVAMARDTQTQIPDPERVEVLLTEAEGLIRAHTATSVERNKLRGTATLSVDLANRYERLLWDAMMHLSKVGLAAFPNDPLREKRYRLDNVYADRGGKPRDPAPTPPA